jgi:aminopeptidase N
VKIDPDKRFVSGYNDITFKVIENTSRIQIDLFENMNVDSILYNGRKCNYSREFNAVFVRFNPELASNTDQQIRFYYSGTPVVAKNAPWDGGFDWRKDPNGKHWVGVAVQGIGASLWYPVKDTQTDEPDLGATIKIAVPNGLMNVSNGRFIGSKDLGNGYTRWDWQVRNPINTYSITTNIGDYVAIQDSHDGLDLSYYVLRGSEEKARIHFAEVKPMMDCFKLRFGEYPFKEDGYKLVETPYLGMEHQSAVAYGNKFQKGYMGRDLSGTGIGLSFDFITVHESGHEWFGNSITSADVADMWIHEAFTTYSESVFVECQHGYEKALQYINGQRQNIANDIPIIGVYGVQKEGSGDMYFKGALMLNTIRHIIGDDAKWWNMLYKFSTGYRHSIIDTPTVITFFNAESGINLTPVFDQYLRTTEIPQLEFKTDSESITYRWTNVNADFDMPVDITIGKRKVRLHPTLVSQILAHEKGETLKDVTALVQHFLIDVKLGSK